MRQAGPLPLLPLACLFRAGSAARSSEDLGALEADSAVGLASDGEEWRICNPFSSEVTRRYYFQSVEEDGDPTAIEFVRDKRSPALIFHKHSEWTAKYEKHIETKSGPNGIPTISKEYRSTWLPASPPGSERPTERSTLLLGERFVEYVRCVPVTTPDGTKSCILEVKGQGKKSELLGGMYFPDFLARQALRHFKNGRAGEELLAPDPDCTSESSSETDCQLRVAATVEAALADESFDSSGWKFKDIRNAKIGAIMGGGFIIGGVVGGPIGAVVGGGLSSAAVGVTSLYKYLIRQKDMDLSASEKIFEKLRCMSIFKTCSGDVLVPTSRSCPEL
mmetsp:Transcript_71424/g.189495  ORF Transcript_71424/g.189495 Transcript_71424/m.189495 type:complete len:334 (+) Transcript_71424:118-1119(+)